MDIAYSGYNGVYVGNTAFFGHEFIEITGATTSPIQMEAYAYEAGEVDVTYSWTSTIMRCCLGLEACTESFVKSLRKDEIVYIGEIPKGVKDLSIALSTEGADLDIQLYDQDKSDRPIVGYDLEDATGLGEMVGPGEAVYGGCNYAYSGFNGVNGVFGNELINITCITDTTLMMKVYAADAGVATVTYSYWN
jgi:hypothetical protein